MLIEAELLGVVNESASNVSALQRKFILRVTAEQLFQWLHFDRKGKAQSSPFRILAHSVIQIDEDIQRGRDAQGFLLQNSKKVMEIANTLLKPSDQSVPRLYLGSLIWNIRPKGQSIPEDFFELQKIEQSNKPTRWRLSFETDSIFLTDSAHRHLGIVEAYRQYIASPSKYPAFDTKYEFLVELYTLNKTRERELFSELNSKQKKISAAKQKQMDVSSPIGSLKDAILEYDRTAESFFQSNIEVSSNQNDKHTLLTMSVFVASISEMFSVKEIKASREDDELQSEFAAFYCEFFYELSRTLAVSADLGDGEKTYYPYQNLYNSYIKPAADNYDAEKPGLSEDVLQTAIDRAKHINRKLREIDVANHNSFVRALSRIGGFIRRMDQWKDVIARLQTQSNFELGNKFFQASNPELFQNVEPFGVSIATLNEDKTINVQVQTKTRNAIYEFLMKKLSLYRPVLVYHSTADFDPTLMTPDQPSAYSVPADGSVFTAFTLLFHLPKSVAEWGENRARLEVDGGQSWPVVTKKGKSHALTSCSCEVDPSYVDHEYSDIVRWRASFEIQWPPGTTMKTSSAKVAFKFFYPSFSNPAEMEDVTVDMVMSRA